MSVSLFDQIKETISLVEKYKSLDESSPLGDTSIKSGSISPAIDPALKLYSRLHDIESLKAKIHLYKYFQTNVQKITGRYLTETGEYVSRSGRKSTVDQISYTIVYHKMKSLVINIINEIVSDIEMHYKQVLPTPLMSFYMFIQLSHRMRAFLAAYRPVSLSPPVSDLIVITYDIQKDILEWNVIPVNDGFDANALFSMHITKRINDKCLELLESCKLCK
nr:mammalian uncoordinated homology 13, domain 2 [Tanacetum cinerariifolium]